MSPIIAFVLFLFFLWTVFTLAIWWNPPDPNTKACHQCGLWFPIKKMKHIYPNNHLCKDCFRTYQGPVYRNERKP